MVDPSEDKSPIRPASAKTDDKDWLWDEYKLVQDKIDKIGDFHFRVRTWAITLTSAIVIGGFANKFPWYVFIAAPLSIFAFNMIDKAQTHWQIALTHRADQIERRLRHHWSGPRVVQVLRHKRRDISSRLWGWPIISNGRVFYGTMYLLTIATLLSAFRSQSTSTQTSATPAVTAPTSTAASIPTSAPPGTAPPVAPTSTSPPAPLTTTTPFPERPKP